MIESGTDREYHEGESELLSDLSSGEAEGVEQVREVNIQLLDMKKVIHMSPYAPNLGGLDCISNSQSRLDVS